MPIRFITIKDDTIKTQSGTEEEIRGCFDFCTDCIRAKVKRFLDSRRHSSLTLYFRGFKVKLEK